MAQPTPVTFHVSPGNARAYVVDENGVQAYPVNERVYLDPSPSVRSGQRKLTVRFLAPRWGQSWEQVEREPDKIAWDKEVFLEFATLRKEKQFPSDGVLTLDLPLRRKLEAFTLASPALSLGLVLALLSVIGAIPYLRRRLTLNSLPSDNLSAEDTGSYQLQELLGEGGMATVYKAVSSEHSDEVAVKIIRRDLCEDPDARERFRREIKLSIDLRHPSLMHLYDWGETDKGRLYLVCELLEGETLKERLQREKRLGSDQVFWVLEALAGALDHLHQRNLVHRDVKPANIFLCRDNRVKLVDLGIARGLDMAAVTQTGQVMGTPRYMSPEQVRGEVHPATDQYALGILALELLSGKTLFAGKESMDIMYAHAHKQLPPISEFIPDASPPLEAILRKMLAHKPEHRFPNITEAISALKDALNEDCGDATDAHQPGH